MKEKREIPFSKVFIGESERKYLEEVLISGWLTTAGKTFEFEKRFAEYVGSEYACAVNSCTAALHLAVESLGVREGSSVFVPSMTFTASAEILNYMKAHPVFLDTEYGSNLITPEILKKAINENPDVKHIIIVHYGGQPASMPEILNICKQNNIKIIEDAAHAFPAKINGQMIGSFGDATCFSFYANKTITTGEGGMLTTNNKKIFERVKTMRLHGISKDIWGRFTSNSSQWEYDVVEAGYKYNMPDVNAAIGLGQLEQAELFRKERQKSVEIYYKNLSELNMIDLPVCHVPIEDHAWHIFPVILNERTKISRNGLIEHLSDAGIGTSVHYKPLHRMTFYKEKYKLDPGNYPNTEKTWNGNVSLPLFPFMSEDDILYICKVIKDALL